MQEPVTERAVHQIDRNIDLGVGGDLTALDGTAEDRPGLIPAWLDHAVVVLGSEGRIGMHLDEQCGDDPAVGRLRTARTHGRSSARRSPRSEPVSRA